MAMAHREMEICSPVASSMSISRREAPGLISSALAIRSSVVSPWADRTTTTLFPLRYVSVMIRATFRMRAVSATELPPNFCTINAIYLFPPKGQFSISAQDSAHHSMPAAFLTPAPG